MDEPVLAALSLDSQHAEERPFGVHCLLPDQRRYEHEHRDAGGKERWARRTSREQSDRDNGNERQRRHPTCDAQADHRDNHPTPDPERANELRSAGEIASIWSREVRSEHHREDDRDRVLENRREDDRRDERGENAAADAANGEKKVVLGQLLCGRPLECEASVHEQRDQEEVHDVDTDQGPDREHHQTEDRRDDEGGRDSDRPADDPERQDLPARVREDEADEISGERQNPQQRERADVRRDVAGRAEHQARGERCKRDPAQAAAPRERDHREAGYRDCRASRHREQPKCT